MEPGRFEYEINKDKTSSMKASDLRAEIAEIEDILKKNKDRVIRISSKLEYDLKLRLSKLKQSIYAKTLKEQYRDIVRREKARERKARAHRLIRLGGIIEMYLPELTEDEGYKLLYMITAIDEKSGYFSHNLGRAIDYDNIIAVREKIKDIRNGKKKVDPVEASAPSRDTGPDMEYVQDIIGYNEDASPVQDNQGMYDEE